VSIRVNRRSPIGWHDRSSDRKTTAYLPKRYSTCQPCSLYLGCLECPGHENGAEMAAGSDWIKVTSADFALQMYNYFGTWGEKRLHYNEDNRFPISPIRFRGGCGERVTQVHPGPDSSPPCRMLRAKTACTVLDEADLDHLAVGRPSTSSPRQGIPRAGNAQRSALLLPSRPFAGDAQGQPNYVILFDEE
jgi:hypothetical protein